MALVSASCRAWSWAANSSACLISVWRCWSERFWAACSVSICCAFSSASARRAASWVCCPANLRVCITQTTASVSVDTARSQVRVLFIDQDAVILSFVIGGKVNAVLATSQPGGPAGRASATRPTTRPADRESPGPAKAPS